MRPAARTLPTTRKARKKTPHEPRKALNKTGNRNVQSIGEQKRHRACRTPKKAAEALQGVKNNEKDHPYIPAYNSLGRTGPDNVGRSLALRKWTEFPNPFPQAGTELTATVGGDLPRTLPREGEQAYATVSTRGTDSHAETPGCVRPTGLLHKTVRVQPGLNPGTTCGTSLCDQQKGPAQTAANHGDDSTSSTCKKASCIHGPPVKKETGSAERAFPH